MSDVMEIQERIKELEAQIQEEQAIKNQLSGKLDVLKERLKSEFKCSTIADAEKRVGDWEREVMGPTRLKNTEEAQQKIVNTIRQLEEMGEIVVSRGGDEEVFV